MGVAMNVNELRFGLPEKIPQRPHIQPGGAGGKTETFAAEPAAGDPSTVRHTRDAEVVRLVQKLNDAPEVRPDIVSLSKTKAGQWRVFNSQRG